MHPYLINKPDRFNNRPSVMLWLLIIATLLLMYKSQSILWVRYSSDLLISEFSLIVYLIYAYFNRHVIRYTSKPLFFCLLLLSLAYAHEIIWVGELTVLGIVVSISIYICTVILILSSISTKALLLKFFIRVTTILVLISLIGWFLLLVGVPLPYYIDSSNIYYTHIIYYFFNLNMTDSDLIPRFAGMFLEPGHLGTMCVFILYINKFNMKHWDNLVLLAGTLASFSLAAYGLLIGAIALQLMQRGKTVWLIIFSVAFILIGIVSVYYKDGDNVLYQYIYSRLEIKDGELSGNNRTTSYFDIEFKKYANSSQIWLGKGQEAFGSESNARINITLGCAGYKRYFFIRGIIGSFLICLFLLSYYYKYNSKFALGFLIVFIVANIIRDYPLKPMWLYLYILALPCMYKKNNYHNVNIASLRG